MLLLPSFFPHGTTSESFFYYYKYSLTAHLVNSLLSVTVYLNSKILDWKTPRTSLHLKAQEIYDFSDIKNWTIWTILISNHYKAQKLFFFKIVFRELPKSIRVSVKRINGRLIFIINNINLCHMRIISDAWKIALVELCIFFWKKFA